MIPARGPQTGFLAGLGGQVKLARAIFSAFLAAIILNELFSMYHLLAMSIVFAGIAIFEYQKRFHD